MVLKWIAEDTRAVYERSIVIRLLGKYMSAIGKGAYILPEKYVTQKFSFTPYIFTDEELRRLFSAIDQIAPTKEELDRKLNPAQRPQRPAITASNTRIMKFRSKINY